MNPQLTRPEERSGRKLCSHGPGTSAEQARNERGTGAGQEWGPSEPAHKRERAFHNPARTCVHSSSSCQGRWPTLSVEKDGNRSGTGTWKAIPHRPWRQRSVQSVCKQLRSG
ncbi:hypothetical protein COCON_G00217680 [Conger conger]|uniref:SRCR domain-containing protein n=1 Tax=Conger conger TaxID=82655 RepID=A0A9Q1HPF0_CONCO|nr:hypothetical protein COCON_G00217680 [Conger conger]